MINIDNVKNALYGHFAFENLGDDEKILFNRQKPAQDVANLAFRLAGDYAAHLVATLVAREPSAKEPLKRALDTLGPKGFIFRKDGSSHEYSTHHYFERFSTPEILKEVDAIWLTGALLKLGDELKKHDYFDHAPVLEMIYHLRNGAAHGNTFDINARGRKRLAAHPANNRNVELRGRLDFEITQEMDGQEMLFDYMKPADVLDLLISAGMHLVKRINHL